MPSPMTGSAKTRNVNSRFFIVVSLYEMEATELLILETSLTDIQGQIMTIR
jgi:hypothetical protein